MHGKAHTCLVICIMKCEVEMQKPRFTTSFHNWQQTWVYITSKDTRQMAQMSLLKETKWLDTEQRFPMIMPYLQRFAFAVNCS